MKILFTWIYPTTDSPDLINCSKVFKIFRSPTFLQNLQKGHFRGRKAAEGGTFRNPPPALRRAPRSGLGEFWRCCTEYRGEFWRCCTEYRGTFRNPPPALRRAPRSGLGEFWRCCTEYRDTFSAPRSGLGEFWRCCTEYRGTFSAPEAFVPHGPRLGSRGPNLGPPRSHRSPKH